MTTKLVSSGERLTFIDGLRGIAALGVALHHLDMYRPFPPADQSVFPRWANVVFQNGWMGVQVFFVISGFVIAYSLRQAVITPEFLARFAVSRWLRLAPAYLLVVAMMLAIEIASPWMGIAAPSDQAMSAARVVAHLLYLQDILEYESLSAGFWTLCIEIQFYFAFALLLGLAQFDAPRGIPVADRKATNGRGLMIVFFPLALLSLFLFNRQSTLDAWLSYYFWMFFAGVLAFWTLDRRVSPMWFWVFVVAIVARLGLDYNVRGVIVIISGVSLVLIGRQQKLTQWLDIPALQYLGRVSYSFYLIHYAVNHLVVGFGYRLSGMGQVPELFWFIASLVVSLIAAHCLYVTVERPSLQWSQWVKRTALSSFSGRTEPVSP